MSSGSAYHPLYGAHPARTPRPRARSGVQSIFICSGDALAKTWAHAATLFSVSLPELSVDHWRTGPTIEPAIDRARTIVSVIRFAVGQDAVKAHPDWWLDAHASVDDPGAITVVVDPPGRTGCRLSTLPFHFADLGVDTRAQPGPETLDRIVYAVVREANELVRSSRFGPTG